MIHGKIILAQLLFSIFYFPYNSSGQFSFYYNDSLVVKKNNEILKKAWGGGLNYAQFSTLDFDYDGDDDIICFDRSSDQLRVFENTNNDYKQVYNVAALFPEDVKYRATCIDYDMDGENDLFTYGIGGIKVYKNIGNEISGLQWQLSRDVLVSDNWGIELNLYVSSADIPAIVDVDNDQDLDILTFHIGGEYLQYHKNLSQELYGHSDSLIFELKNECWGGFREDLNTNTVTLNDQSSPCQEGNVPNAEITQNEIDKGHSGSTIIALDYDGSGVKDLILGDVSHTNLILLLNGGDEVNSNSQMISQDISFPSNTTPVNMSLFPAVYYLDVDFDNKKDLIVCPNAKNVSENVSSCWKYKNIGNNLNHNFSFETKSFLQEDMIEHGTGSIPVFADINGDGLEDMFVSNFYKYKPVLDKESAIAYYQNTGTIGTPEYTFIDNDFNNIGLLNLGLRLVPTFGDLNNDGKLDLLIGQEDGTISYFQNNSSGTTTSFQSPIYNYEDNTGSIIDVGQYASPQMYDINKDGLLDLLIGSKNGTIHYYRNTGSQSYPIFELINSEIGGINVSKNSPDGYAVPHVFANSDSMFIVVGSFDGSIHFFGPITENDFDSGNVISPTSEDFLGLKKVIGKYSAPWINDIDSDGDLDLYIGQDLGGLFRLENTENSTLDIKENTIQNMRVNIYPNPTKNLLYITLSESSNIRIMNSLNTEVFSANNQSQLTIDTSNWPGGIYYIYIAGQNNNIFRVTKI